MFGKNKKSEEAEEIRQGQGQLVIHTMSDDLSDDYEDKTNVIGDDSIKTVASASDEGGIVKSASPFAKTINQNKKELSVNTLSNKSKPEYSSGLRNESKTKPSLSQTYQNVFFKNSTKPFSSNNSNPREKMQENKQEIKNDSSNKKNKDGLLQSETTIEDRLNKIKESSSEANIGYSDEIVNHSDGSGVLKKIVYLMIILVVIGAILTGGYYSWKNKDKILSLFYLGDNIGNENQVDNINNMDNSDNEEEYVSEFSEKTNFLVVNDLNKDNLMNAIAQTFDKIPKDKLLEFVIVDSDNVTLLFPEFSNAMGLSLDPKIMKNLKDEFSIFLYKKADDNKRVSLLINISNKELLLGAISVSSNALVQEIRPLFLDASVSEDKESSGFSTSIYEDVSIRYNNLSEKSDLSLDYAIVNDKLMLATSKDSGRLIIDKLTKESNAEENMSNSTIDSDNIEIIVDDNSNIN